MYHQMKRLDMQHLPIKNSHSHGKIRLNAFVYCRSYCGDWKEMNLALKLKVDIKLKKKKVSFKLQHFHGFK